MRHLARVSIALTLATLLSGAPHAASAQQRSAALGIEPPGVAGTWVGKAMVGPKDSVVATYQLVATASRDGWTVTLPNRPPLPGRIVAMGGDSVVFDTGPFESILRPGVT